VKTSSVLAKQERRQRAQRFLRDALAHGPKRVSDVEEAAAKAHIETHALEQARADLGIVTSRANAGGGNSLSVQWSLPG
jgi:Tfp pilus assembly protein PilF